ncbi:MAG: hypothetical protein V4595_02565 [Pseudomonadota bacterium]
MFWFTWQGEQPTILNNDLKAGSQEYAALEMSAFQNVVFGNSIRHNDFGYEIGGVDTSVHCGEECHVCGFRRG